jgi:hypothetical protein
MSLDDSWERKSISWWKGWLMSGSHASFRKRETQIISPLDSFCFRSTLVYSEQQLELEKWILSWNVLSFSGLSLESCSLITFFTKKEEKKHLEFHARLASLAISHFLQLFNFVEPFTPFVCLRDLFSHSRWKVCLSWLTISLLLFSLTRWESLLLSLTHLFQWVMSSVITDFHGWWPDIELSTSWMPRVSLSLFIQRTKD